MHMKEVKKQLWKEVVCRQRAILKFLSHPAKLKRILYYSIDR